MGSGGSKSKTKSAIDRDSPKTDVLKETDEDPVSTFSKRENVKIGMFQKLFMK